jgi:hypothetical protein
MEGRCWPHLQVRHLSYGGPRGHCRYSTDRVSLHTSSKLRQEAGRATTCRLVSHGIGPYDPIWEGSGATSRPSALDLASLHRRALVPPRVQWLLVPPP